ncbi:MAG: HEAT repeat domain-containing protein [Spirochaetaceae bacterium]|nr:HEAT repeat domain-containing protein [Spirochaetaceae bacterium]
MGYGQTNDQKEVTVEQAYLSSVEDIIIKELASSEGRDNKLVSLQYIESALNNGRVSTDMHTALNSLAGEGVFNMVRENGRMSNNYPDIRAKACELLGRVGNEEASSTLVKIVLADNEPMVLSAAIRSLADIGINNNDEVVSTIAWTARKFDIINPTSSLALDILNAYEKLASTVENKTEMVQSIASIATNYAYVTPVRNRAHEVLKKVSGQ